MSTSNRPAPCDASAPSNSPAYRRAVRRDHAANKLHAEIRKSLLALAAVTPIPIPKDTDVSALHKMMMNLGKAAEKYSRFVCPSHMSFPCHWTKGALLDEITCGLLEAYLMKEFDRFGDLPFTLRYAKVYLRFAQDCAVYRMHVLSYGQSPYSNMLVRFLIGMQNPDLVKLLQ